MRLPDVSPAEHLGWGGAGCRRVLRAVLRAGVLWCPAAPRGRAWDTGHSQAAPGQGPPGTTQPLHGSWRRHRLGSCAGGELRGSFAGSGAGPAGGAVAATLAPVPTQGPPRMCQHWGFRHGGEQAVQPWSPRNALIRVRGTEQPAGARAGVGPGKASRRWHPGLALEASVGFVRAEGGVWQRRSGGRGGGLGGESGVGGSLLLLLGRAGLASVPSPAGGRAAWSPGSECVWVCVTVHACV